MDNEPYDSTEDTLTHITFVRAYLMQAQNNLMVRSLNHDQSSLVEPEKSFYDKYRPLLSSLKYNSPEYLQALDELRPAIQHHYERNSHHPEHFETSGISGMSLFDVLEMVIDWKAAIDRKGTGTSELILDNFEATCQRFNISPQLASIIRNTANEFGW